MSGPLEAAALEALLARHGADVIVLVDSRLRIVRAGEEAAELAERRGTDLRGLSLIGAFGSVALDALARAALADGRPADGEASLGRLGGRTFAVEAVPIAGGGLVLSLHDVTNLRRMERVRRDFVANISHELRTPLASIKLMAETLAAGATGDDTAREFATQIEREVDHLAQLVAELLDLSTIESGAESLALEELEPSEVVANVVARIGPVAERRGVAVRVAPASAHGAGILADAARLGQALLNLAHNAVKYSQPNGEVRIGWQAHGDRLRFTVADDGIGIPPAQQARIFERFYKVDRSRSRPAGESPELSGSAGLGLAIVRHIAEAHGGRVGVESSEGVGSTFWIELPRAD